MLNKEIFSQRLKQLRLSKGLKQDDIGKLINVSKTQISDMERGRRTTTLENLAILAEFFSVTSDYLMGTTDDPSTTLPIASGKHYIVCLNNIVNNIKSFRIEHNMSQKEFAKACNVSVETISSIEREKCSPRLDTLAVIATFMGVTVTDLLN